MLLRTNAFFVPLRREDGLLLSFKPCFDDAYYYYYFRYEQFPHILSAQLTQQPYSNCPSLRPSMHLCVAQITGAEHCLFS